jgi:hypothetical protein
LWRWIVITTALFAVLVALNELYVRVAEPIGVCCRLGQKLGVSTGEEMHEDHRFGNAKRRIGF